MSSLNAESTTPGVALVTGAGSGMGRSTADAFLARGWTVLAVDVAPVDAAGSDGRLIPLVVDVRDRAAIESALAEQLPALGGALHAVANVAGIYPPSTLDTYTAELFHKVFDVNVLGVLNVMAAAVPYMPEGSGIVNFASVDGFVVSPGQLVYGASKAAVVMITKATALELAPRGIRSTPSLRAGSPPRATPPPAGWRPPLRASRWAEWRSHPRSPSGSGCSPVVAPPPS